MLQFIKNSKVEITLKEYLKLSINERINLKDFFFGFYVYCTVSIEDQKFTSNF